MAAVKSEDLYLAVIGLDRSGKFAPPSAMRTPRPWSNSSALASRNWPLRISLRAYRATSFGGVSGGGDADALQRAALLASILEQPLSLDGQVIDINVASVSPHGVQPTRRLRT